MMETLAITIQEQIPLIIATQVMKGELTVEVAPNILWRSERQIHER